MVIKPMMARMLGARPTEPLSVRVAPLAGGSSLCAAFMWFARFVEGHVDLMPDLPPDDRAWLMEQAVANADTYGMRLLAKLSLDAA